MRAMTVENALIEARKNIEHDGWCQGAYCNDDGAFCAEGAIRAAAHYTVSLAAINALEKAVGVAYLPEWNDRKNRTQEQVLKAFDKAIKRVKQTETK